MRGMAVIKQALLSVSDKTGLESFARMLSQMGVELLATGGTLKLLRESKIAVREVSEHTGFPEMMDGRVKTLHPKIHGGLLALRDEPAHRKAMEQHGIAPIDLVAVNLYPFEQTVAREGCAFTGSIAMRTSRRQVPSTQAPSSSGESDASAPRRFNTVSCPRDMRKA